MKYSTESIFSQLADNKNTGKSFEAVILNSKVNSKAFASVLVPNDDAHIDDAQTIWEIPRLNKVEFRKPTMALHAPEIKQSGDSLEIIDITAVTMMAQIATSSDELELEEHQWIKQVRRITKSRYEGHLQSNLLSKVATRGQFSRYKVNLSFRLRQPLELRAQGSLSMTRHADALTYQNGDVFNVFVSPYNYRLSQT